MINSVNNYIKVWLKLICRKKCLWNPSIGRGSFVITYEPTADDGLDELLVLSCLKTNNVYKCFLSEYQRFFYLRQLGVLFSSYGWNYLCFIYFYEFTYIWYLLFAYSGSQNVSVCSADDSKVTVKEALLNFANHFKNVKAWTCYNSLAVVEELLHFDLNVEVLLITFGLKMFSWQLRNSILFLKCPKYVIRIIIKFY